MGPSQDQLVQLLIGHRAMLLGYITLIVGDPHLAEDVFQEVAVVAVRKSDALKDVGGFPAWARQIARFKALNTLRARKNLPQALDDALLDLLEKDWAQEDGADRREQSDLLHACLDKLAPHARHLLELRFGRNVSGKALADSLGQPLNTVYVTLSRVYRTLSACLKASRREVVYE
jgi:RNA polymerase sigma-70 factor, ECF subfamily